MLACEARRGVARNETLHHDVHADVASSRRDGRYKHAATTWHVIRTTSFYRLTIGWRISDRRREVVAASKIVASTSAASTNAVAIAIADGASPL